MTPYEPGSESPAFGRRELLRMSAVGGGAAAAFGLLGLPPAAASGAAAPAASEAAASAAPNPAKGVVLFKDPSFNFEAMFALGGISYGAGEAGEIIATQTRSMPAACPTRATSTTSWQPPSASAQSPTTR